MNFIAVNFLWALFLIAIPIAIHLFHFRKFKMILFSNVAMLEEIQSKRQNRRKLRDTLILICRILSLIFLVFAFAQPSINKSKSVENNAIVLFIDNSFSMDAVSEDGRNLDMAKKIALQIVNSHKQSTQFMLLSQNFSNNSHRFVSQEEVIDAINRLEISPFTHNLSEIIDNFASFCTDNRQYQLYILSDFQTNCSDFENIKYYNLIDCNLYYISASSTGNIAIDSIWCETPLIGLNVDIEIFCNISNHGNSDLTALPLKLLVNDKAVSFRTIDIEKNSTTTTSIPYSVKDTGILNCCLQINDHPVQFDDNQYFTLNITPKINILALYENELDVHLKKLFSENPQMNFTAKQIKNIDFSSLQDYDFIFLSELTNISSGLKNSMVDFVKKFGNSAVIPSAKADLKSYNALFDAFGFHIDSLSSREQDVKKLLFSHPLFEQTFLSIPQNIELPKSKKHYPLHFSVRSNAISLIENQDRTAFLATSSLEQGKFFVFSTNFSEEFTNFAQQPLFVVTLLNMPLKSFATPKLYSVLSNDESEILKIKNSAMPESFVLKSQQTQKETIPYVTLRASSLFLNNFGMLTEAGNYLLLGDKQVIGGLSYNYDRKESDMKFLSVSEIKGKIFKLGLENFLLFTANNTSAGTVNFAKETSNIWKIMLILTLLFILAEGLIQRFWK
ncbi:MAG: BatA domain-containing protein [Bacteroidales bacterium]|jgi:hypothetical protein|nr:BatA domain-containing protein [Bacteroidales bacterium]